MLIVVTAIGIVKK